MTTRSDDDVIASRTFEREDGEVLLQFHRPAPYPDEALDADPDDPPWRCAYTIRFPKGEVKRRGAVGIDGVQALLLAFASAKGDLIYVGNGTPEQRPPLRWLGENDLGLVINDSE